MPTYLTPFNTIILPLLRFRGTIDMTLRLFLLLFLFCGSLIAQEHIAPLHSNPQVRMAYTKAMMAKNRAMKKATAAGDTVTIPFIDDFSKPGPYPNPTWWLDSN